MLADATPACTAACAARTSTGKGDVIIGKLNRDGSQMVYSNVLGGSSQDSGRSIAVDSRGNAYVTGFTRSVDFPTTRGAVQTKLGEGASQNAFVARFNAYGHLEYSTYLGGSASDDGHGIAVDSGDNAYVTGYTSSSNFPRIFWRRRRLSSSLAISK